MVFERHDGTRTHLECSVIQAFGSHVLARLLEDWSDESYLGHYRVGRLAYCYLEAPGTD